MWLGRHVAHSAHAFAGLVGDVSEPSPAAPAVAAAEAAAAAALAAEALALPGDGDAPTAVDAGGHPAVDAGGALSAAAALRLRVELSALAHYRPMCEQHHADMHYSAAALPLSATTATSSGAGALAASHGAPASAKRQRHQRGPPAVPDAGESAYWVELTNRRLQVRLWPAWKRGNASASAHIQARQLSPLAACRCAFGPPGSTLYGQMSRQLTPPLTSLSSPLSSPLSLPLSFPLSPPHPSHSPWTTPSPTPFHSPWTPPSPSAWNN